MRKAQTIDFLIMVRLLFLFFPCLFFSQNITVVYSLKYKPNSLAKDIVTETYFLDIMGKESLFRSENEKKIDSLVQKTGVGTSSQPTFAHQLYIQKDLAKSEILKHITAPMLKDKYFIRIDELQKWVILKNKMRIGDLDCQQAELNYGGRHWTAWFAPSVNVLEGPYVFNGLPGLIVKISDDTNSFDFDLTAIKMMKNNERLGFRKGKEIDWLTFQKLQQNYYDDPFAEIKAKNIKYTIGDNNNNPINPGLREITNSLQKNIRLKNNPIELNHKIDYK